MTTNAAKTLHLDAVLGSIDAGKKADLAVVAGTCSDPWSTMLHARPRDVRLVLVGGVPSYGDESMQPAAPASPGCEALDICGVPKFACLAESGGPPTDKFGQTYAAIVSGLTAGFADYDALSVSQWTFSRSRRWWTAPSGVSRIGRAEGIGEPMHITPRPQDRRRDQCAVSRSA